MTVESRRAQCPVCASSIRVADGRIVDHTRRAFASMWTRASWCAGSGVPVESIES